MPEPCARAARLLAAGFGRADRKGLAATRTARTSLLRLTIVGMAGQVGQGDRTWGGRRRRTACGLPVWGWVDSVYRQTGMVVVGTGLLLFSQQLMARQVLLYVYMHAFYFGTYNSTPHAPFPHI